MCESGGLTGVVAVVVGVEAGLDEEDAGADAVCVAVGVDGALVELCSCLTKAAAAGSQARSLSRAALSGAAGQRRIERRSGVLDQSDPGGRAELAALCSARSLRRSRAQFKPSDRYELLTVTRSQQQQQRVSRLCSPGEPPPNGAAGFMEPLGTRRPFSAPHTETRTFQQRWIKWSSSLD
ncbi:hypothetical protein MHYP_G00090810 [Metynnis hypsauchen]